MDETFIKMCREAKEIQEQKELIMDSGDLVINKSNYPDPSFVFCVNETVELESDKFDWILRQEDLQEIAMNFLINKVLDEDFEAKGFGFEWMKREYGFNLVDDTFGLWYNGYVSVQNYNQLWLCFVMETCYNKRWNSEQGVWEVIG